MSRHRDTNITGGTRMSNRRPCCIRRGKVESTVGSEGAVVKVLIADDHAVVREGLKQILSETADISVVAEADNGQAVLDKVRSANVDVVVLDIAMPGRSGLDILLHLK